MALDSGEGTPASVGARSDTLVAAWGFSDSPCRPKYHAISVPPFGSEIEKLPDEQAVFIEPAKERRRRKDREAKQAYRRMSAERLSLMSVDTNCSTECSRRASEASTIDSAFVQSRSRGISQLTDLSGVSAGEELAAVAECAGDQSRAGTSGSSSGRAGCNDTESDTDGSESFASGSEALPRSPTTALHDGVQRRAAEQTMVLMLKQHARRQNVRYGRRTSAVEQTAESRVEDRAEVAGVARDCQVRYSATLDVLEKNMTLRAPRRAHTITMAELSQYIPKD